MAAICPICKKNKMRLGGMAALDGTYCGKCFDVAIKKGIDGDVLSELKVREIAEYIEKVPPKDTKRWLKSVKKKHKEAAKNRKKALPYLDDFRKDYADYFQQAYMEENTALQSSATQIFWHVCQLRKRRLLNRGISVNEEAKHRTVSLVEDYLEERFFDGKYEITEIKETVADTSTYKKNDKVIYQNDKYNEAKYILHNAHQAGDNEVVCPSCGHVSDRSNLIDGCDYCGTKFTVEDLGLRVAEYQTKERLETSNNEIFFSDKDVKWGAIVTGLILCILGYLLHWYTSIFGGILFIACSGFIGLFLYGFVFKFLIWYVRLFKGNYQNTEIYLQEEQRRSEQIVAEIRQHDPLFSAESCYAEVRNIVMAHYYADKAEEVSAFWEHEDPAVIEDILSKNRQVIHADMLAVGISDYRVDDRYQYITIPMTFHVLREEADGHISEKQEEQKTTWVKAADCKSQAVCGPKVFTCKNCGASVTLMEGGRCHYCDERIRLSQFGWAVEEL